VAWDGVDAVLSTFTATRDSTAPLPAEWPHDEWHRPGIIMELDPEELGDIAKFDVAKGDDGYLRLVSKNGRITIRTEETWR